VQDNLNLVLLPEQYFRRMDGEEFLKAMPVVLDDMAGDQFMEDIKAGKADWEEVVKKALEEKAEGWEEHEGGFVTRYQTVYVPLTGDHNTGFYRHTTTTIFQDTEDNS
jgi:hypothetical protein